tara:strand:+ start:5711 stop:5974 length:264 start_codon:yes stop_codon:yes gene_type:complete
MWKYPQDLKGVSMDVNDVANALDKHEAVCAERWKTIFNKIENIEGESDTRFNRIDQKTTRIESILIGFTGFMLVTLSGVVVTMITMH